VTKLLVVDDSALMRRVLGDVFQNEAGFEVAFARDGVEAWSRFTPSSPTWSPWTSRCRAWTGWSCLDRIMVERPCPVVMVSSLTRRARTRRWRPWNWARSISSQAGGAVSLAIDDLAPILIEKVRGRRVARAAVASPGRAPARAARARLPAPRPAARFQGREDLAPKPAGSRPGLVLIGTSTGGPPALDDGALRNSRRLSLADPGGPAHAGRLHRLAGARLDGLCALP
jgi:two-component system chemotaxis response regulator CheB